MKESGKSKRWLELAIDIIAFAAGAALLLVCTEAAFRLAEIYPPLDKKLEVEYRKGLSIFRPDPDVPIPFGLEPNVDTKAKAHGMPGYFHVTTNSLRMRGREISPKKPPGVFRVLVMGDSWTFGEGVNDDETFCARLEELLNRRLKGAGLRAEVLNAAYTAGYSPDSAYVYLHRKGFAFKPDVVIYASVVSNDIFDVASNDWPEKDELGLPRAVVSKAVCVNTKGEYGYIRKQENANPFVTLSSVAFLNRLRIYSFYRDLLFRYYTMPYVLKGEKPEAAADDGTVVMKRFLSVVRGLDYVCAKKGVRFLFVSIPALGFENDEIMVNDTGVKQVFSIARRDGIMMLNLKYDLFKAMTTPSGYDWTGYYITGNWHWAPKGNRVVAKSIYEAMRFYGILPGTTRK